MTSTAATQVFGLPELLETILLHLDTKQLFAVQRVSQDFRDTNAGSKKLQRNMLLLALTQQANSYVYPPLNSLLTAGVPLLSCFGFMCT